MASPTLVRTLLADAAARSRAAHAGAALIREEALSILKERYGLDFEDYRQATISRRIANRIIASHATGPEAYLEMLREQDGEIRLLAANLTIKVSRFYRNAPAFDLLQREIIPDLRVRFGSAPLRVWSAGCAAGDEAYTLAMLLDDADEPVCATDIDEGALERARTARYAASAFTEMPPALMHPFFESEEGGTFCGSPQLRDRVRFLRHDLSDGQPPDALPFHLICCRNVLIYFSPLLQERALRLLVSSLAPGGVLLLGEAEWPRSESDSLATIDHRSRLFRRIPTETMHETR